MLYNEKCVREGRNVMSIADFREKIVESLLAGSNSDSPTEAAQKHFLRETDEREQGKRSDRRKRPV